MDQQTQITEQPKKSLITMSRTGALLIALLGGILLIIVGVYIGMQYDQIEQASSVTESSAPANPNFVSPIQSGSDLTSLQTTLDNADPAAVTSNMSQNDTDSQSF